MLLNNLFLTNHQPINILIDKGKIFSVSHKSPAISHQQITFKDAIVFPGLINSHDHLDFNLFPPLGNRIYNNYVEWGKDIHQQNKEVINSVLKIPQQLRIQWGIYKNLLNGVTTVVNHGPKLPMENDLITVWQKSYSLHSVANEKKWKYKLNIPFFSHQPVAIHIGEGTDKASAEEINTLIKWNLFNRKLIGIHAVAMSEKQAANFKAIVWCPDSNYFLLGRTAAIDKLKQQTKIIFGTDSTVSSHWNLWEHLRLAVKQKMVTDNELLAMLSAVPAEIWNMPGIGAIADKYDADMVIARNIPFHRERVASSLNNFFALNSEDILMVLHKGNIRLFDEELYGQLVSQNMPLANYYKIFIKGKTKYIYGNLPQLIKSVRAYYPQAWFPVSY